MRASTRSVGASPTEASTTIALPVLIPDTNESVEAGCAAALALSRYVQRALAAELGARADDAGKVARLRELAAAPWTRERIEAVLDESLTRLGAEPAAEDFPDKLAVALRRLRRQLLLGVIARDLGGVAPLAEVVGTMTALAEVAVQRAVAAHARALARVHGVPTSREGVPQDLLVVAMGKGGGGELNVSSDLDLIFVYDEDGETRPVGEYADARRPLTNHEFFERLGRRLIGALSDPTADGFVFRVDMRLRPNGDAGPLAVSNAMLEEYLVRQGREWERFAWLKGRVISAPVFADAAAFDAQCRALDQLVRPFVYRKYLDFNAIASLRDLHALIRAETSRKRAARAQAQDNVKLGRGGIREIEFIAQTFQVIRGGREARLRDRSTLATLATLAQLGALAPPICERLAAAYEFLRRLEHALQYVDDAQTHLLPSDPAELARVAAMLRLPSAEALRSRFDETREFVAKAFDAIFLAPEGGREEREGADANGALALGEPLAERMARAGYANPAESAQRVGDALAARRVLAASDSVRRAIERLVARAVDAAADAARGVAEGGAPHATGVVADEVLARFLQLIDVIAGRSTYVALLNQYPNAFARVLRLLASSRWATDYLVRHPILLDELLDERLAEREITLDAWPVWGAEVAAQLAEYEAGLRDDPEPAMNLLRDAHHAQVFRLLLADLDGRLTVERLADHLSALADVTIALALAMAWKAMPRRHRGEPRFAVIGYGKIGGKELGYASDLDLVFVYDDDHADAGEIYTMLARRLITWLAAQTSSGNLFDVDLRLRPHGEAGLLVSSFESFKRYQRNDDGLGAWTWEHQALTRARYCAGYAPLGAAIERLRNEVLARERDLAKLAADVLEMRKRMLEGHPNRSPLFDLKHDRGGMVDIEFIVQYLVLAYSHRHPRLLGNLGNIALLAIAGELGLIDARLAAACADAYRLYRKLQHGLRLNGAPFARVPHAEVQPQIDAVRALWRSVFGTD
jgi:glutamate-ammonia-ligase adenylyltransferase